MWIRILPLKGIRILVSHDQDPGKSRIRILFIMDPALNVSRTRIPVDIQIRRLTLLKNRIRLLTIRGI